MVSSESNIKLVVAGLLLGILMAAFRSGSLWRVRQSAGLILTPMMLGSVAGSAVGGIFQTKTSYRNLMFLSVIAYFAGMLLLSMMSPDTSRILITLFMILVGFGMGFSFSLLPTASIHNLDPRYRGSANSTNSFLRSLGMTLGITIFGTIQNNAFMEKLKTAFNGMGGGQENPVIGDPQQLFQSGERSQIPGFVLDKIVGAMSSSITHIFALALIPIAISAIAIAFMGKERVELNETIVKES